MTPFIALLLGMVEGLTEFLPISSTGHLILLSEWLGHQGEGADSFNIVIQLGAMGAVLVHYRELLRARLRGLFRSEQASKQFVVALALGFLPTAVAGLAFRKVVKKYLFGPLPVAVALFVGGIVMIALDRHRHRRGDLGRDGLEHITPRQAWVIGLGQCLALWPGASRSMCTILTGQGVGLSTGTAAEFSFLLGLPTLGAATVYEAWKARDSLLSQVGLGNMAVGLATSFFVAWAVIASFLPFVRRRGLEPFGYYRIALAGIIAWNLASWSSRP
jgi:undecaprenyl-diphosphatase